MSFVVIGGIGQSLYGLVLLLTSVFLILLILIQRGRGGGLSGAFGGAGGQSAFGAKAGDTFTRITIGVSTFWILLCIVGAMFLRGQDKGLLSDAENSLPAAGDFVDDEFSSDLDATTAADPSASGDSSAVSGETTNVDSEATTPATEAAPASDAPDAPPETAPE